MESEMRPAIDVALKHVENATNLCIMYSKNNNAYGTIDDRLNGTLQSLKIIKKLNQKHSNRQKCYLDENVHKIECISLHSIESSHLILN